MPAAPLAPAASSVQTSAAGAAAVTSPAEASSLKLKPKVPAPTPDKAAGGVSIANWPTAEIALPISPGSGSGTPASAPPSQPASNPTPSAKPIHIPARGIVKAETGEPEKPEQRQAFKLGVTIALIAAGLIVCVAGFFGWKHFSKGKSADAVPGAAAVPHKIDPPKQPASPANAVVHEAEPVPTPAPTVVLTKTEADPAKPNLDQPRIAAPADQPAPVSSSSSTPTTLAPGVTANVSVPNTGASPEFRAWVANVKISGVFQGANSRAFINGQMTRVGEPVDTRLGIVFEGIDPDKKQIIFKDATGATATRKY